MSELDLWKEGETKQAIVDFVEDVAAEGSKSFVSPDDRVAVFDNDGTLWCEKPMYIQLDFILRRLVEMATKDPRLRDEQPWKAAAEQDLAWFGDAVTKHYQGDDSEMPTLMKGLIGAFAGFPVEELTGRAGAFLRTQKHPTLGRPYVECTYAPMVELLRYLEDRGFTNYVASGGGRDFMRIVTDEIYGVPPERVIGSSVALEFVEDGDGGRVFTKAELDVLDDGLAKPVRIWSRIGKRPLLAAGNSNGDIQMLQFANEPSRPGLRLLVLHDDDEREFAYTAGAEESLDRAKRYAWTVVSMRNDWSRVFEDS